MSPSEFTTDELSLFLISLLQRDGRKSFVDLAKEIGVSSHNTVRKRLDELHKENKLRIVAETNANKMGLEILLILFSTFTDEDHSKLIDLYSVCPRVFRVGSLIGNYDVFIFAYAENRAVLESMTRGHCFYGDQIQVRDRLVLILGEETYPPFYPLEFPIVQESDESPCKVSCIDCGYFQKDICAGCPSTTHYKGPLAIRKK